MSNEISSKIPISKPNINTSNSRKRNSLLTYSHSSRLPLPINSCNNLNSLLNNNIIHNKNSNLIKEPTDIYSQRRLSLIPNNSNNNNNHNNNNENHYDLKPNRRSKIKLAYRNSLNIENFAPTKEFSNHSNIPSISNLSLHSKIPRSTSIKSINNTTPLKLRNNNTPDLLNQNSNLNSNSNSNPNPKHNIKESSLNKNNNKQLKFSYYTTTKDNSLSNSHSLTNLSSKLSSTQKSNRLSTIPIENSIINKKPREKIRSIDELLNKIKNNPLTKNKFINNFNNNNNYNDIENYKKPYLFEDLSSKRPDMFEKLTMYERIQQYPEIYFTGLSKELKSKSDFKNSKNNHGFDDKNGNYIINIGDHIRYKYEIKMILGKGAFGSVLAVIDHSINNINNISACKIIKNDPRWSLQAVEEIKILKKLNHKNILNYKDHFIFRSHMCIITEILTINLYESIQLSNYKGFSLNIVKKFTKEILEGISYLHSNNIIHCDLKPENIMISNNGIIKLIDFGSSCYSNKLKYSYLQSRFYRSPEVLLGGRYDFKMDIWSIALISIELFAGLPLIQPQNEWELFQDYIEYFNIPSRKYILNLRSEIDQFGLVGNITNSNNIENNTLLWKAFDSNGGINMDYINKKLQYYNDILNKNGNKINRKGNNYIKFNPGHGNIKKFLRKFTDNELLSTYESEEEINSFLTYLDKCLVWNKWGRATADECLRLEFFSKTI